MPFTRGSINLRNAHNHFCSCSVCVNPFAYTWYIFGTLTLIIMSQSKKRVCVIIHIYSRFMLNKLAKRRGIS